MNYYLIQASYTSQAIAAMVKNPQDRAAAVRPMIEKAGGKLHGLWFTFGDTDIVAIAEMPNNISAAAISMAIGASGVMSSYRSTALMTSGEAVEAMQQAAGGSRNLPDPEVAKPRPPTPPRGTGADAFWRASRSSGADDRYRMAPL